MNTKINLITVCLCFVALLNSLSAQEEVDYASKFYKIQYDAVVTANSCPDADSVEILDIYGNVFYRGNPYNVRLEDGDSKLMIKKGGNWSTYDIHGKVAEEGYTEEGYTIVYSKDSLLQGLVDAQGKIIIPIEYEEIWERYDISNTNHGTKQDFLNYFFKKNGKWGLLNQNNQVFLPFKYDGVDVLENYFGERMLCLMKDEKISFADAQTGKPYTDFVFSELWWDLEYGGSYNWRLIPVKKSNSDLWGFIDYNGKMVVPCKYKYFDEWGSVTYWEGYVFSAENEKNLWDVLDVSGKVIVSDCQDVYIRTDSVNNIILVKKNDQWFVVNSQNGEKKHLFDNPDLDLRYARGDYAVVEQNEKKGVLNVLSGQIIVPCQYDYIHLNIDCQDRELQYAACMNYEYNTILDYVRLNDGVITKSYSNYRGKQGSPMVCYASEGISYSWNTDVYYSGVNAFVAKSGYTFVVSCEGKPILDESYKIQGDVRIFKDFIITDKGIYDITGKLLRGESYQLKCTDTESFIILYNNQTQKREYYIYDEGKLHEVNGYDGISKYFYAQCQEKFRNQPSDVDKDIPVVTEKKTNTYAFIIANENYSSAPDVPFSLIDGRSFKEYCEKTLGILPNHIRMYENATMGQLITCVEQMKKAAEANEGNVNIIFYYAGHAFPINGNENACLLPVDGDVNYPSTGYGLDRLYNELGWLKTDLTVCFIDACFSGDTRDDHSLFAETGQRGVRITPKESELRGNMVVFAAATGTETAHQYKEKKHGLFTYYLLKKLQESKGNVTLGELNDYIIENVKKMSYEIYYKLQTPKTKTSSSMELKWKSLNLIKKQQK